MQQIARSDQLQPEVQTNARLQHVMQMETLDKAAAAANYATKKRAGGRKDSVCCWKM